MNRIFYLLAFLPLLTLAQSKTKSTQKLPLIQSISSDTLNGKCTQVLFTYDQSNRVIGITQKELQISTTTSPSEQLVQTQIFE